MVGNLLNIYRNKLLRNKKYSNYSQTRSFEIIVALS